MDLKIHRTFVLTGCAVILLAGCSKKQPSLQETVQKTVQYQMETVPRPESASIGGEWTVISLMRSGEEIPDSYGEIYLSNLKKRLKENEGILSERKYTEYARAALATAALGENPGFIEGYDLLEPLTDLEKVTKQGINGAVFALLALDTVDNDAYDEVKEALTGWILECELPDGGFTLDTTEKEQADADITAMVLQALAPYQEQEVISAVIDRGVEVLSDMQSEDGTYASFGETNCETAAQVLIALSSLGINGQQDERFVKGETGVYDALMGFYDGKGGFSHVSGGETDAMATDQALCGLDAYLRYQNGENALYDMKQ